MAYLVELSFDLRHWPQFQFEDEVSGTFMGLQSGEARAASTVPTRARLTSDHKELPDFIKMKGCWAVSEKFKDLVEGLEPHVHQFFPVQLTVDASVKSSGKYFLLNICQKVDAVIPERSNVSLVLNEATGNILIHPGAGPPKWTLDKSLIKEWHLWRGDRQLRNKVFFSDKLMDGVHREGLVYIEGEYAEEE